MQVSYVDIVREGCFSDGSPDRTMNETYTYASDNNTIENCAFSCSYLNSQYMGVKNG